MQISNKLLPKVFNLTPTAHILYEYCVSSGRIIVYTNEGFRKMFMEYMKSIGIEYSDSTVKKAIASIIKAELFVRDCRGQYTVIK